MQRDFFKDHLAALLALTGSCGRWCTIAHADWTLWTDIFVDIMFPISFLSLNVPLV